MNTACQAAPLHGLGVLLTRPAHQADPLCRALVAAGAEPIHLPLLGIDGPTDANTAAIRLTRALTDDLWIFTSANAVAWADRLCRQSTAGAWPPRLAAAGRATATALAAIGRGDAWWPPHSDGTAGLLALPQLAAPQGWRVTIVCGERSRSLLRAELARRGAQVDVITVYRRRSLAPAIQDMERAVACADAAIVTSGESLQTLVAAMPPVARARLFDLQLVLPSPRVVKMAGKLGFRSHPLMPDRVDDESFVNVLVRWRTRAT